MVVKKQRTVVTGPSTSAPAMGSRTNSTQALPKSSHKPIASTNKTISPKGTTNKKKKQVSKKSANWLDILLITFLSVFTLYAHNTCSSPKNTLYNPLCRSLYAYKTHIVDPHILPPIQNAYKAVRSHPAVKQVEPYVERVRPHAQRAGRAASHYTERAYSTVILPTWNNCILPASGKAWNAVLNQYHNILHPRIQPYLEHLYPYTSQITSYFRFISAKGNEVCTRARPRIIQAAELTNAAYIHGKHYGSIVLEHSRRIYILIRPYLISVFQRIKGGACVAYRRTKPLVIQAWEIYVGPHLSMMGKKVIELSGKREGNGNRNRNSGTYTYRVKEEEETKASTTEGTVSTSSTPDSSTVSTTEMVAQASVETAATPELPEEPVVPVASFTSSSTSTSTSLASGSEAQTQTTEELASASSVIADRAPPEAVKASLVEEIASSSISAVSEASSATPSSPAVPTTEELASASSVIADRNPASSSSLIEEIQSSSSSVIASATSAVNTPEKKEESTEDDIDSFLADLGVSEENDVDSFLSDLGLDDAQAAQGQNAHIESEQTESEPQTQQREEESPEARAIRVQIKRTEIENRHTLWEDKLVTLVEDSERDLREFLSFVRMIAGAVVGGKTPDQETLSSLEMRVDLTKLKEIDGLPVGGLIHSLEKEGQRLLAGVDGWVKREREIGVNPDVEARKAKAAKFEQLVNKVKERFVEKVGQMQEKVHRWYVAVRDVEVQECLQVVKEVESLAGQAQSDIGMDYAWLEDVTYDDWQRYHDLGRTHEHFDKIVRHMQNPEQNQMPEAVPAAFMGKLHLIAHEGGVQKEEDQIVLALATLEQELNSMVLGWEWKAKEVEGSGRGVIYGESESGAEVEVEEEEHGQNEVSEEPVKILPISPVPGKEETVSGGAQVPIIGKSKEQVEEAMKVAGLGDGESIAGKQENVGRNTPVPVLEKSKEQVEEAMKIAGREEL